VRPLSSILLPVDFSERAVGAARYAVSLAEHFHCNLTLLHAIPPVIAGAMSPETTGPALSEIYRDLKEQSSLQLKSFLPSSSSLDVKRLVVEGDPATCIVEYAHEHQIDLIVMPTHGYGPFRRFILGSNTAKVLHDADCPVWTGVHMQDEPTSVPPIESVLCAVDLGPQSVRTLEWAAWLAHEWHASLTLLHVATGPDTGTAHSRQIHEAVEEELERLQQSAGTKAAIQVESGETAPAICSASQKIGASVLVIGRGSAAGVFGRLRTNAYAIIRQSPCPVVSV
jgi:nucleotide-binding universal stress UspA family protein